ncbi:DsbA family protein [Lentilactobacillus kefiri]|jgi:predicted DsbA family dithiol-disulfide isomerase|uniref:Dithiol-disulfide isomerase n=2 Tax=Lentilactobacillus kefiri TaxID=33962 RepID=A0A8E1V259_LENKE|nr:DsbA family protein [Lentilactobacillus kefiri]KRL57703.1 hypothetical protein FD08_GL003904 [Lentilactobacillus parakefiri DSM 10551]KRM52134.1 hypothetical protein FC95_GL001327 [Lentilactobacillus kefiri DSM 20587 = JCM 5818]MCJ2161164.1 DsbA family protein [Lentilactobacillus kefiri]MCP9368304.1 DsbA family protein [Lentilactobacillus kefiri]MDH5108082.1 DsbA family protein [Lentilactobacillus kefiri]
MVLEIYLFVDPLNRHCYDAEKTIERISQKLNKQISVRFVSMLNIKILHDFSMNKHLSHLDQNLPYDTILDFKAASFQGKKFGRHFLMDLQKELLINEEPYTDDLVYKLAERNGLDIEMFKDDRRSDLAEKMFKCDQRVVHEMDITDPSTTVLFNSHVDDCGIRVKDFDYNSLFGFCAKSLGSAAHFEQASKKPSKPNTVQYPKSNLRFN